MRQWQDTSTAHVRRRAVILWLIMLYIQHLYRPSILESGYIYTNPWWFPFGKQMSLWGWRPRDTHVKTWWDAPLFYNSFHRCWRTWRHMRNSSLLHFQWWLCVALISSYVLFSYRYSTFWPADLLELGHLLDNCGRETIAHCLKPIM